MNSKSKASLLWIDLEMTGLDPNRDRILEVGAIATDFNFKEIARYESVVKVNDNIVSQRMVGDFWQKNYKARDSLIKQNNSNLAKPSDIVQSELVAFIDKNFNLNEPIYLAGNSIHQDQKFIEREWPELNSKFHYRQLDVSAFKIIFSSRGVKFSKPEEHRAMSDIIGSIEELKYYLKRVNF